MNLLYLLLKILLQFPLLLMQKDNLLFISIIIPFSIGDIDTFVCERAIKAISVVTNQGEVYILNKLDNYSFDGTRKLLTEIYNSYPEGEIDDKDFVKKFLRRCREGGIEYAKSK